jgi:transcription elongation factor GreB
LIKRLEIARPIDTSMVSGATIRFGAIVVLEDEEGEQHTWRLYGEDEVDVARGILSWKSPIGRALMGREEGDVAVFQAPGGRREVEIVSVTYEAQVPLPDELSFSSQ